MPVEPSAADVVYRGGATAPPAWAYDVGVGDDGRPVVLYATFPSATDHRYHYARWTGSRWVSHEITPSGPTIEKAKGDQYYAGGMVLDSRNASVVYLSRQVEGAYQIERWVTGDGGADLALHARHERSRRQLPPGVRARAVVRQELRPVLDARPLPTWLDFDTSIRTRLSGP